MFDWLDDFTKNSILLIVSAPIQITLILIEIIADKIHGKSFYKLRDTVTNIYLMLLNMGLDRLLILVLTVPALNYFRQYALFEITQPWLYWLVLLVAEDFLFYWQHYFDHRVRLLWAVHVTHHTSKEFNLTVGFRSSVLQPVYRFIYFIPLALMGFEGLDIMFMYSLTQIYGILVHTRFNVPLKWLEYVLVTPSHHRVHHASNDLYIDKNMGMVFIVWDRLFGTFQPELPESEYEPIRYGITKEIKNPGPLRIIFHEWIDLINDFFMLKNWRERLYLIVAPPEWISKRKTANYK
jgi:sterol desaturase/sphingolipid hydroxylase (fatty acid hydroxylase superfamily)